MLPAFRAPRYRVPASLALVVLALPDIGQISATEPQEKLPPAVERPVDFVADVRPIFVARCYSCHGPEKQKSGFRLDVQKVALEGGEIGGAIVRGESADSPLIAYVGGLDSGMQMPPEGE